MTEDQPNERWLTLINGLRVPARQIRPEDAGPLQRFHRRLSARSIYLRHFGVVPELSDQLAAYFTSVDGIDRLALIALDPGAPEEIIAVVRYDRLPGTTRAEYAALVEDRWQGRGVGLGLTRWLVERARENGVRHLYALVMPENVRMLRVLQALDLPTQTRRSEGVDHVEVDISPLNDDDKAAE